MASELRALFLSEAARPSFASVARGLPSEPQRPGESPCGGPAGLEAHSSRLNALHWAVVCLPSTRLTRLRVSTL